MFDKLIKMAFKRYKILMFMLLKNTDEVSIDLNNEYIDYLKENKERKEHQEQQEKAYNDFVQSQKEK
ncbi:MAG: hypothetical protein RR702_03660 [Clostridia bacterium]